MNVNFARPIEQMEAEFMLQSALSGQDIYIPSPPPEDLHEMVRNQIMESNKRVVELLFDLVAKHEKLKEKSMSFQPVQARSAEIISTAEPENDELRQKKSYETHLIALKALIGDNYKTNKEILKSYYEGDRNARSNYNNIKIKVITVMIPVGFIGGALIGASVGAGIGVCVGGLPGAGIGAGTGAVAGGCLGLIGAGGFVIPVTKYQVTKSDPFKDWKDFLKCIQIDDTFQKFLAEDSVLKDCVDECFTHNIFQFPVKAPDGKIYERDEIMKWIDIQPVDDSRWTSPYRIPPKHFTVQDLVFDEETFIKTSLRVKKLVNEDISNLMKGGIIRKNLTKFLDSRKVIYRQIIGQMREDFAFSEDDMTHSARRERKTFINNLDRELVRS